MNHRFPAASTQHLRSKCRALIIASLSLMACSSDNDDTSITNLYDGQWERDCESYAIFDGMNSDKNSVFIDGEKSTRTREIHDGAGCLQLLWNMTSDSNVSYGETFIVPNTGFTAQQVDLSIQEVAFIPRTEQIAIDWNESRLCGLDTYVIDQPTVVGLDCELLNLSGSTELYGLWAIDSDLLYFGVSPTDAVTPEERPTTLNIDNPYRPR